MDKFLAGLLFLHDLDQKVICWIPLDLALFIPTPIEEG